METILDNPQTQSNVVYAGFWLRFVALIIDGILLGVIQVILTLLFFGGAIMTPEMLSAANGGMVALYYIIIVCMNWLYYAYMESSNNQATLGKMALGMKVTGLNGERISFMNATGRYFAKLISAIIIMIGYLMAAFTEKKQALHDMIASTLVVRK